MTASTSTSPVEAAWAKYDAAALRLRSSYEIAAKVDTPARRAARMNHALEVARLWKRFMDLFATLDDGDRGEMA